MSNTPLETDILLRPVAGDATQCVLVAAKTLETIMGPLNVADGAASARSIADRLGVTIWLVVGYPPPPAFGARAGMEKENVAPGPSLGSAHRRP